MQVRILGSAAGGGFPQWNCACPNCRAVRAGTFSGKARTQTQVAISTEGNSWFLLGASPDLRAQIEATTELQPRIASGEHGVRQTPIAGVVLANADLDHVLGLLLLRELQPLRVHATSSIRRILTKDNSMFGMLQRVAAQVSWTDYKPGELFALRGPANEDSGLRCRALALGEHYPAYVSPALRTQLSLGEGSMGLMVEWPSGKRLAFMPALPHLDDALVPQLDTADLLLFDGTFWNDEELIALHGSSQTARSMGHVPVSSGGGSLIKLAQVRRPRKIYIHVNNTNPMLNEAGAEYRQVREAGWEIAEDGWQFDL
jgi:pyrroloquinoline quinone biosynthesis protein B